MKQHIAQYEPGLFTIMATEMSGLPDSPDGRQPHPEAFRANVLCNEGKEWREMWCIRIPTIDELVKRVTASKHEWIICRAGETIVGSIQAHPAPLPAIEICNGNRE